MRWMLGAVACAALGLASCGGAPVSGDTAAFVSGITAFRSGDRAALDTAVATLKTEPASEPAPCSAEAFAAQRRSALRQVLEPLSSSPLQSMSEEARFVYLAGAVGRGVDDAFSPAQECEGQENVGLLAMQDNAERTVMITTIFNETKAWRESLVARYGEQLNSRLKSASHTLTANGYDVGHMSLAGITE